MKETRVFFSKPFKTNITLEMNKVGKYAYETREYHNEKILGRILNEIKC